MKTACVLAASLLLAVACKKENAPIPGKPPVQTHPEMQYIDLQDREMKQNRAQFIDLDKNGSNDIGFATWYIGDPIEKEDEVLFFAASYVHSNLLTGENNNSPIFKQGDTIPVSNKGTYNWYQGAQVEMARKNISLQGPPYWELDWKQVNHKYLAVQVVRDNKPYNGWVELSFDTAGEKLILHKAAICKEANKAIVAGK